MWILHLEDVGAGVKISILVVGGVKILIFRVVTSYLNDCKYKIAVHVCFDLSTD